jgi:hypothetical protein
VIALARGSGSPPVILINHADHVFWLGTTVADVLSNMRESGRRLAAARRGVDAAHSLVMARPLMPHGRAMSRAEAKRELGVHPDQVLLVTAADASKYRPVGPTSFLGLVAPVLEIHEDALLLAAGPRPHDAWAEAARRTGGRVRALGRLPDVATLQQAADIYVDSFPFSSLTSLLEAGSFGTPTITYRGHPGDCGVLGADTPGVDEHMFSPSNPEDFQRALSALIADPERRAEVGERTQRAIREAHTGERWHRAMAAVYEHAARSPGPPPPGSAPRETGVLDALVCRVMEQTGLSHGASGALRDNLALLPVAERVAASSRLTRAGSVPPARHLIPEWMLPRLGHWRRRVAALGPAKRVRALTR